MDAYRRFGNFINYIITTQIYNRTYTIMGPVSRTKHPLYLESMLRVMLDITKEMMCNAVVMP